jgi:hypothetical protein
LPRSYAALDFGPQMPTKFDQKTAPNGHTKSVVPVLRPRQRNLISKQILAFIVERTRMSRSANSQRFGTSPNQRAGLKGALHSTAVFTLAWRTKFLVSYLTLTIRLFLIPRVYFLPRKGWRQKHFGNTTQSKMIYAGDGMTDIPCFSLIKKNGGTVFGVFNPKQEQSAKRAFLEFLITDRVVSCHAPKYRKSDELGSLPGAAVLQRRQAVDLERQGAGAAV